MDVHVVSHTHWDREWYHGAARFRQRLVRLIDELLDLPGDARVPFLLDGQTVLLEDYLLVRPERRDVLTAALRDRRLEAGPWYVLADELIPAGESLVRNLLAARSTLRTLGATAPPVLYSPDAFGHAAALPRLAAGFGLPVAIVWRGYGGPHWPPGDSARWLADDDSEVLLWHLPPTGYEAGSSLPTTAEGAAERWRALSPVLSERSVLGVTLLPNGADHHALQRAPNEALRLLAQAASPHARVTRSTLSGFAAEATRRAAAVALPEVRGELRDSYGYAWTLQGTFATRTPQKRRAAAAERLLLRDVEPWVALAALGHEGAARAALAAAWRTLLRCHPHDTLCGCSIDDVARAMDVRLESVQAQGEELRDWALASIVGYDAAEAREHRDEWKPMVVVRNRAVRPRGGVAEVELLSFLADEPVGPGSADAPRRTAPRRRPQLDGGRVLLQPLDEQVVRHRLESPRHYPDNDLVLRTRALCWVPPVPALGCWSAPLADARGAPAVSPPHPVHGEGRTIDNGILRVTVQDDGRIRLDHRNVTIDDLLAFESRGDVGDTYTPSLTGPTRREHSAQRVRLRERGPLRAAIELRYALSIPASRTRSRAAARHVRHVVTVRLSLDAAAPFLRIAVHGENRARDHRLRLLVRTGIRTNECWADAAFGPVRRGPAPERVDDDEVPVATAPLHRYLSCFDDAHGATIYSDGLPEYELLDDGWVAVTLVRAVGELSRSDLPERPGHAGWPVPTPDAQCIGRYGGELALLPHGPRDEPTIHHIEQMADDVLLPLSGHTVRDALTVPWVRNGIELEGDGLSFGAIKPATDGNGIVVRCVNLLERVVHGRVRAGFPIARAVVARLDETQLGALELADGHVEFAASPREAVTMVLYPASSCRRSVMPARHRASSGPPALGHLSSS